MNIAAKVNVAQEAAALLEKLGVEEGALHRWRHGLVQPGDRRADRRAARPIRPADAAKAIDRPTQAFQRLAPGAGARSAANWCACSARNCAPHKADLGRLVSIEAGKIPSEGLGEVQEMIDICDFAVGLSRQLYGLTIATERPGHRMMETWHPLGVVGVISAFNFPVAVWSWNAALALVCGDAVVWKPSEKTPLTALACAGHLRARRRSASATRRRACRRC